MISPGKFIAELRRRRVFRVSLAYMVVAWLLIETSSVLFPAFLLPDWTHRLVAIVAVVAFPVVVILAWVFDISTRGIVLTENLPAPVDGPQPTALPGAALARLMPPAVDSATASIAILPFEVLSSDPEDRFIAQGVAAEVSSALSKLSDVRVVPRASTAGEQADIRDLGLRLGVQYVLSGSLRRQAEKIRIIVELADATDASQLWSETYHRVLDDVMEVEEAIAGAIVGSFGGERLRAQIRHANVGETKDSTAWSLMHKARSYVLHYSQGTLDDAEALARQALELDPDYAAAHATLADVLAERITNGLSDDPESDLGEAVRSIRTAMERTPNDPVVLKLAGNVLRLAGRHDEARGHLSRAVELAPFDFGAWGYLGSALAATDDPVQLDEAHAVLDRILEMAPQHPGAGFWWHHKALACTCQGDYANAVKFARRSLQKQPGLAWALYLLANAQQQLGDTASANQTLERATDASASLTPEKFAAFVRRTSATDTAAQRRLAGLAGLNLL